jgi:predicted PurR-regulated permease PerM
MYLTTIAAMLAMIVGFHFLGPLGLFLGIGAVIVFIVVMARRRQDRDEREALRRMAEQDELR